MTSELRVYAGTTGNERRNERRARLIAAGFEILADEGPLAFTVRGVCRRAGLASRYFYETFENADELAAAIYDEHTVAVTETTLTAIQDIEEGDVAGLAREAMRAFIGYVAEDRRRGQLMFSPALEAVPAIEERREASTRLFVGLAADELTNRLDLKNGPAVAIAAEIVIGGLTQALSVWMAEGIETKQEEFVAVCTEIFTAVGAELTRTAA